MAAKMPSSPAEILLRTPLGIISGAPPRKLGISHLDLLYATTTGGAVPPLPASAPRNPAVSIGSPIFKTPPRWSVSVAVAARDIVLLPTRVGGLVDAGSIVPMPAVDVFIEAEEWTDQQSRTKGTDSRDYRVTGLAGYTKTAEKYVQLNI
ncbi:hypothetical protein B0H13DRAFT_1903273 [Mycena leptocephala]|nr:hypothetical protein B0H13DRAFT_1903273 [Mycena leptocephala]